MSQMPFYSGWEPNTPIPEGSSHLIEKRRYQQGGKLHRLKKKFYVKSSCHLDDMAISVMEVIRGSANVVSPLK